jgi:hypothetical protein
MKISHSLNQFRIVLFAIIIFLPVIFVFSQADTGHEITDGTEYWFCVPHCKKSSNEPVRWGNFPIQLWISSKVITKGYYESADGTVPRTPFSVGPDNPKVLRLSDNLMHQTADNEIVRSKGIHVFADDPVSIRVFVAYQWSGEAFNVIPLEWNGTKYYTLNMYQDYCRMEDGTDDYKPCQIVITATEDYTNISYKPTAETAAGIKPGQTGKATLMKGQTFLIEAKILPDKNQQWSTDLTGTCIEANKKIYVISGHTKGAFPRFPKTMYGIRSAFVRNMLCDMMLPVELLGTEYISAPLKYINRVVWGLMPDDKGDIIRFVPTQDGTIIYQMRDDGTEIKQISPTLKAGTWYDILSMTKPAYYQSNKPVLVGQYGKSYVNSLTITNKSDGDSPLNPPLSGQGMMFSLIPPEHWCSFASFRNADGMDNFIYITFRAEYIDSLKFDGIFFKTKFGTAIKYILGTPYAYITEQITSGPHFIMGLGGATFTAYPYGTWDKEKDGFSYGYPAAINYASDCNDSINVKDKMVCGIVDGTVTAVNIKPDTNCAALFSIIFKQSHSYNYSYIPDSTFKYGNKTAKFKFVPKDVSDSAIAVINFMSRSGRIVTKTYQYYPEKVASDPQLVNFGVLVPKDTICMEFDIVNKGKVAAKINELKLKRGSVEYWFKAKVWPFTLAQGERKTVTVCAAPTKISNLPVIDTVIAVLTCYEKPITTLFLQTSDPIISISDADWGCQPVGKETAQTVTITNEADADVTIEGPPTWPAADKVIFTHTDLDTYSNWPITIKKGGAYNFQVYFKPNAPGNFKTTAWFTSNAQKEKIWSDWVGCGINPGPTITGYDWGKVRVIDSFATVDKYEGTVIINCLGDTIIDFVDLVIDTSSGLSGIFEIVKPSTTKLLPNTPINVKVYFSPKIESKYLTTVTISTLYKGSLKKDTAKIQGTGVLPHINVAGEDFGSLIFLYSSISGNCKIEHKKLNPAFSWPLTIFDLSIQSMGAEKDSDCFAIDPQWYQNNIINTNHKLIIPIDGSIDVPVIFTAKRSGKLNAHILAFDDAPFAMIDNHSAVLNGEALDYQNEVGKSPYSATIYSLSPNPVTDKLLINFYNNNSNIINLRILNELGTILIDKNILATSNNNSFEINTQELLTGVYYCNISAGNYFETKKFIIIR